MSSFYETEFEIWAGLAAWCLELLNIYRMDSHLCLKFGAVDLLLINFGVVDPILIHKISVLNFVLSTILQLKRGSTTPNLRQT